MSQTCFWVTPPVAAVAINANADASVVIVPASNAVMTVARDAAVYGGPGGITSQATQLLIVELVLRAAMIAGIVVAIRVSH